ncbi:hypothetical protein K8Z61_04095 [Nocardioides sp. TRM66260-LWL]|uniref:MSMEG_0567/sll0787 family protein n=1 Tax=Nocardioides sp. TRM66260-LWL TaxID=2874478 RepID=UPI001CC605F7|nr:MSMEG_0567/sll0787 family protein [Nocardioides sp. TRM66260-LWL]MBZ5733669.1 hypothetical protein [Nocardioides sp. TRM66260-LWL]
MSVQVRDPRDVVLLGRVRPASASAPFTIVEADARLLAAHRALRHAAFVEEQGLFVGSDRDAIDDDPRTRVLVALTPDGAVVGGVRLHPVVHPDAPDERDLGWWRGGRLVVAAGARRGPTAGVGSALVRAACAAAESAGALRFDATVQPTHVPLFERLGWRAVATAEVAGRPHVVMDWPIARVQRLVAATKEPLGSLVGALLGPDLRGDDAALVPGTGVGVGVGTAPGMVAACDAILPSMVERDPEWAGWCAVLVNVNDVLAMGAEPLGLLDAVAARDASFARRILRGLADAADAYGVPVLGGHTQLGVNAALSVTALGRVDAPVPGGGGSPGEVLRLTADLGGGWRRGQGATQWDSTSHRTPTELRALRGVVPALAPSAAKDVSMSGLVGTAGMLAEASGCRAVLDVAAVPVPADARAADWLTCFPGFAMITAEPAGRPDPVLPPDAGFLSSAVCGGLEPGAGVGLRWPDGVVTEAVEGPVTGLGAA